jgi:sirohydrochlorin cobaltochelatase
MSVLLGVAHGSRDPGAQDVVRELLARAAALRPGLRAEAAYVDNAAPSIRRAVAALVAEGERDVTVVPLLLGAASHSKTDVAASVQAARLDHPAATFRYGRPLGPHPVVVEVLARRLTEAGVTDLPVVVVAGGSLDPDANAGIAATARLLWEGRDYPSVDYAFVSATRPSVGEALERLRAQGHRHVALARYFLGPGHLPTQVEVQAAQVDLEVVVSAPLGATEGLAALVLGRYDEARTGDVRMNCDACLYRVGYRGLEHEVGAPQVPHTHPDDTA